MWPGLDVPTLAGVKGHGGHESRCQVPFRNVLKACLVFFSSNRRQEASVGLRRCEGEYFPRERGERLVIPLRIVDSSQKRSEDDLTLQFGLKYDLLEKCFQAPEESNLENLDTLLRVSAGGSRDYILPAKCLDETLVSITVGFRMAET